MNKITGLLRKALEPRETGRRWVYLLCAAPVLYLALLAGHEGLVGALPYFALLLLCLAQFSRPTLIGWLLLVVVFWAYALAVAAHPRNGPLGEFFVFLSMGLVPAGALIWCRPKRTSGRPSLL